MMNVKVTEENHLRFMKLKQYPATQDEFFKNLLDLYEKEVKRK